MIKNKIFIILTLLSFFSFGQTIEIVTQEKIQGNITILSYSPTGSLIASGSEKENSIKIWDLNSGKIIGKLEGHQEETTALEFNTEGTALISSAKDNKVILWDLVNWTIIDSLTFSTYINDFKPIEGVKNQFISAAASGEVHEWNGAKLQTPQLLYKTTTDLLILDSYNKHVVSGAKNGKIQIYDRESNTILAEEKVYLSSIKGLHFFNEGKELITAGSSGKVNLWNINDLSNSTSLSASRLGLTAFDINTKHNQFVTVSSLNTIKVWDLKGTLLHEFKSNAKEEGGEQSIRAIKISPDGTTLASSGEQKKPKGSKIVNKNVIRIWDLKRGVLYKSLEGTVNPIYTFDFHPTENKLVTLGDNHTLTFWDFSLAERKGELQLKKPKRQIAPSRNNSSSSGDDKLNNGLEKGKRVKRIFDKVVSGDLSDIGTVVKSDKTKELGAGILKRAFKERSIVKYSSEGNYLITKLEKDEIRLYSITDGVPTYEQPLFSYQPSINQLLTSPNEKYLAVLGGGDSAVSIIDLEKRKIIKKLNTPAPSGNLGLLYEANSLAFSPNGNYLAVCFNTGKTFVYSTTNWKLVFENVLLDNLGYVKSPFVNFSKTGEFMVVKSMDGIKKYSTENFSALTAEKLKVNGFSVPIDKPQDYAITIKDDHIYFEDLFTGEVTKSIPVTPSQITHISINPNGMVGITFKSGQFTLLDPSKGKEEVLLVADGDNYIFKTADNFYKVSKDGYDLVTFRIGNQAYPFEQFDAIFNRPDLVLTKMGCTDNDLISLYEKAYKKRIKKLGLTPTTSISLTDIPKTELLNAGTIPAITEDKKVNVTFKVSDNIALQRYNIWVNNVPIYGKKGKKISGKSQTITASIPLIFGLNKVQLSCQNKAGYESLIETFYVEQEGAKPTKDLYLVTIGTSAYKDDRFELTYPAKDGRDFIELMTANVSGIYNKIHVDSLFNSAVTKENIEGLKLKLEQSKPNDVVIVFVAGHGILDANFDYYFGTYDIDFSNPNERGLAYDRLEHILDGIKANKKILIMDTCHSGEVDKDDIYVSNEEENQEENQDDISFRAVGTAVKEDASKATPSRMAGLLFNDLRKGTGATVISSAGGVEYAMESDEWKNGLFTYCMLMGLETRKADLNNDGTIMLLELQEYVIDRVTKLSKGKQTPNSRIQNIELDFPIW